MNLHQAARKGDLEAIRTAHASGKDLNATDKKGRTPLSVAASGQRVQAVELLLELGADPALADADGRTPVEYALDWMEDPQIACRFVQRGASPNARGVKWGHTPLIRAAHKQDVASTLWLVQRDADVKLPAGGQPPLLAALMAGMSRVWRSGVGYVEQKPDPRERLQQCLADVQRFLASPSTDAPPVDVDTLPKHVVVRVLLKAGADPNQPSKDGFLPIIMAAQSGDRPMVRELLKAGADPNRDYGGETALYRAAEWLQIEIIEDLLQAGADPNLSKPSDGTTPLMQVIDHWPAPVENQDVPRRGTEEAGELVRQVAHFFGEVEDARRAVCPIAVDVLVRAGADVNARDRSGHTALVRAVRGGCTPAVELLLRHGAGPTIEDHDGRTAFDYVSNDVLQIRTLLERAAAGQPGPSPQKSLLDAIGTGNAVAAQAALARGADVNPKEGYPPLLAAVAAGKADVVLVLVQNGARINPEPRQDGFGESALVTAAESGHAEVVQVLLEHGADLEAADQGRNAALMAVGMRHWHVVDVLLAMGFTHPDLAPFLAIRQFSATAHQPAFREWVGRIAQRLDCEAVEVDGIPGVYSFAIAQAEEAKGRGQAAFAAGVKDNQRRKQRHQEVVAQWSDKVRTAGYHLLVVDAPVGMDTAVYLVPSPNQYAILAAVGTDGMNYGVSTSDVIRWLQELEREIPLLIDGAGHDKVEGRFLQPIPHPKSLAKRMYQFCPDIVDQGCGSVAALAKELTKRLRFYFWWD